MIHLFLRACLLLQFVDGASFLDMILDEAEFVEKNLGDHDTLMDRYCLPESKSFF